MNLKDKFSSAFGAFGIFMFYLLSVLLILTPLMPLGFPWWLDTLIAVGICVFPVLGGIASIVFWIWSFIIVVQTPFSAFTVIYFIALIIYCLFFLIPSTIRAFTKQ